MTYNKYIEQRFCCFIPGRVLDIAFAIVRRFNGYLDANQEVAIDMLTVLVEVRDYSRYPKSLHAHQLSHSLSMAMEHFEEYVAPGFPIKPPYSGSAFRPSRLTFNNIIRVGGGSSASFSENHDEVLRCMDACIKRLLLVRPRQQAEDAGESPPFALRQSQSRHRGAEPRDHGAAPACG